MIDLKNLLLNEVFINLLSYFFISYMVSIDKKKFRGMEFIVALLISIDTKLVFFRVFGAV